MGESRDIVVSDKLGKNLRHGQKVIVFGMLIIAILFFVYSFIFMTPFSDIYQIDGQFLYSRMINFGLAKVSGLVNKGTVSPYVYSLSREGVDIGMNMAWYTYFTKHDLQTFNHWIFAIGFFVLLASLLPFVYASQKRKIYYKTNYIVNSLVGVFTLYVGIHFLVQLIINQQLVWKQDFNMINAYKTYLEDNSSTVIKTFYSASDSNGVFIIGYIISISMILFSIGYGLLTYTKYKYLKKQPKIDLNKVVIHE